MKNISGRDANWDAIVATKSQGMNEMWDEKNIVNREAKLWTKKGKEMSETRPMAS